MPNTKEHAILARAFGIDQLILVVTKMDKRGIDYRKEVFDDLHEALRKMLTQIGFSEQKVVYVPASGYLGENVTRPSPKMQWHDGPTFLNTFLLLKPAMRSLELPFRMPIDQVLSKGGIGTIATGKVATGMIHRGHKVIVQPEGIVTTIKSIQEFKVDISYAAAGDDIGVALRGIKRKAIRRGSVLGNPMAPPMVGKKLLAKVLIMNHPSRIRVQYTPTLFVHSKYCPARITRLVSTIDPLTERVLEREPDFMKSGDTGYMELSLQEPIVIEHSSEFPRLSKFVMRDQNATVGVGTCVEIIPIS
jgi:elongation factor 1-alpha